MTTANLLLRSNKITVKHFEFWSPRFFEAPYYLYLLALCAKHRLAPKFLAKANYALDHGEIGIGSKLETQLAFDQRLFLPSILLEASDNHDHKVAAISKFAAEHQFPVILKPDMGCVGKGVIKVSSQEETLPLAATLTVDYILQKYTHFKQEFGVFFVRHGGRSFISGIKSLGQ